MTNITDPQGDHQSITISKVHRITGDFITLPNQIYSQTSYLFSGLCGSPQMVHCQFYVSC